jgi:hypothetical protein
VLADTPLVLNKPLYSTLDELKDIEIVRRNTNLSFDKSGFLTIMQWQQGEDQATRKGNEKGYLITRLVSVGMPQIVLYVS